MHWIFTFETVEKQPSRRVLRKRCSENMHKFTGEHPFQSVISIKLQRNFTKIALRHGCSPVNLLHILRTPFPRNTSGWLLLDILHFRLSSCNKGKCFQKGWMFLLEKTDVLVWCLLVHFFCWISNHFLRVSSVLMLWLYLNAGYLSSENVNEWGVFLLLLFFFVWLFFFVLLSFFLLWN